MCSSHSSESESKLTQEQIDEIREDYEAAMRGEVVDALEALEEIRREYDF